MKTEINKNIIIIVKMGSTLFFPLIAIDRSRRTRIVTQI